MKIPIFAEAMKKCDVVLRPRGYDIVHIICDKNPTIYDNIINCFLGIAAIQIGLVDTLYAVGVKPNYMIGHSVGELGCSYADGCFTAEEMILSALSRGLASVESDLIHGTMAAVGLGYKQLRHFCPENIDIACHNGPDSSTISGPTESIKAFVKELQSKGIFAKTVPTSNIAFHSRYISPAGPKLLEYLKKVISYPKNRSKRWLCTSIPKNEWHLMKAHLSSPEYHTNNLLSPVLFEEILTIVPKNAITLEVSPHGLLQAILRKSLDSGCINLSLAKRGHKDNATLFLSRLGKLYNLGFPITPGKLYPRVPYPVSRETPSISPLVRWEHSSDWHVESGKFLENQQIEELVDLESDKYKFLRNFKINGNVIISLAVYLKLVVNMYSNLIPNKANNTFILENIIIYNKLLEVPRNGKIHLIIMIFRGSGKFEVKTKDEIMIASGTIRLYEESYNIISRLSTSCSNGTLKWSRDWRLLLEGLVQVHIISSRNKNMLVPSRIQKLVIDMEQLTEKMKENYALPMKFEKRANVIACPGIAMSGIQFKEIKFKNRNWKIVADELRFIQNINKTKMDIDDVLNAVLGLISKNISINSEEKILLTNESKKKNENILDFLENIIKRTRTNFNIKLTARELLYKTIHENYILTIINNAHYTDVRRFISTLGKESFLLTIIETKEEDNAISVLTSVGLNIVLKIKIALCRTALLLHKERNLGKTVVVNNHENCLDRLKICLQDTKYDNVIFVVNTIIDNDIFEILRDIKGEPAYKKLQIFDLQDAKAPKFSLQTEFYESQIKLNLRENVLAPNGVWGTYRWMPLRIKSTSSMRWQAKINKSGSLVWMEKLSLIKEKNNKMVKVKCSAFDLGAYEYCPSRFYLDYSRHYELRRCFNNSQAYLAAFCILHSDNWRFKKIKTVLIHYGASDVGQALINLSLSYNFDVYTTYETDAEKRVIESLRPSLPKSNIIKLQTIPS
ncbi:fatty acid synthase-like [Polistes fuscatus]|uniref:fatty acid synthase-like n=1 Tax=Polistes fuscatus TaxID=30207 RepID=UPI001CA8233F|nr:fatty acid synthase-like [Polistes fuscatus]